MKLTKQLPPLEYLQECFEIDLSCPSGLRWKKRPFYHFKTEGGAKYHSTRFAYQPAGNKKVTGYYQVILKWELEGRSERYASARIVYALFNSTIDFSGIEIDHIDKNPQNNNPENLRLATSEQNSHNRLVRKDSSSGIKGVSFLKNTGRWKAKIISGGKIAYEKTFKTKEEAKQAYERESLKIHGDFSIHI